MRSEFVFCINSFSLLYYYCILRALMRILLNADIQGRRYVPESSLISMYSREWQVKWFIDTKPSLFKYSCDQHFVQNMHISRSNHAVYFRWHATPPCATLKKITIAYEKSVRSPIPINTDHLFFRNAFSLLSANHTDYHVLPLYFCHSLSSNIL